MELFRVELGLGVVVDGGLESRCERGEFESSDALDTPEVLCDGGGKGALKGVIGAESVEEGMEEVFPLLQGFNVGEYGEFGIDAVFERIECDA